MAIYAIGDVQGCFDELQQLLQTINFNADADQLWFCGDIVNRGPRSLATLQFIHSLGDNAIVVLGNHDLHLLAAWYHHRQPGRKDTLDEVLNAPDAEPLLDWLRQRPLMHYDEQLSVCLVHAGLHPAWSLDQALSLATEVQQVLCSERHTDFFRHMYGDKPHFWSDELKGWPRLRYITNVLTRVRYFNSEYKACLNAKSAPGKQPDDMLPWFDFPERATRDQNIVFGHWSTLALVERDYTNVYPIDHGCLWGGKLTALRLDDGAFDPVSIPCKQAQNPGDAWVRSGRK